jgi:hypothetical protein
MRKKINGDRKFFLSPFTYFGLLSYATCLSDITGNSSDRTVAFIWGCVQLSS